MNRDDARARFRALVEQSDTPPLDECVALIAAEDQDGRSVPDMLAGLDRLARGVGKGGKVFESVARLNHRLFVEEGLRGDEEHYDDPRNSFMDRVLERKLGLPILLSVIYLEVARRVDLPMCGVGFPGHFLVSPIDAEPRFFIDAFHGGQVRRVDDLRAGLSRAAGRPVAAWELDQALAPVDNRAILVRINNNLKGSYFRRGDLGSTLRAVDRLLALRPDDTDAQQERAWLRATMGGD